MSRFWSSWKAFDSLPSCLFGFPTKTERTCKTMFPLHLPVPRFWSPSKAVAGLLLLLAIMFVSTSPCTKVTMDRYPTESCCCRRAPSSLRHLHHPSKLWKGMQFVRRGRWCFHPLLSWLSSTFKKEIVSYRGHNIVHCLKFNCIFFQFPSKARQNVATLAAVQHNKTAWGLLYGWVEIKPPSPTFTLHFEYASQD